jgi:hypothetical protein
MLHLSGWQQQLADDTDPVAGGKAKKRRIGKEE